MDGMIKIKLYRSPICTPQKHKRVVLGLGLLEQLRDKNEIAEMRGLAVEKL
jgi:ribosomal protein L30/L7E